MESGLDVWGWMAQVPYMQAPTPRNYEREKEGKKQYIAIIVEKKDSVKNIFQESYP